MPLQIKRLIGFLHGILYTRCFCLYALLSLRHHMIHFCCVSQDDHRSNLRKKLTRCWFSNESFERRRRIRVIKLHDIYVDSEYSRRINFNYESLDDAYDHPDQKVNRNLMLFDREFLMLRNFCSK